ncbi:MAG: formylglycine-generating enzyme family protein [Verrucomicrobia bacterium]|nr:formylglycine-generating enzyme family protein [Verrucomicrobiota bacterium]
MKRFKWTGFFLFAIFPIFFGCEPSGPNTPAPPPVQSSVDAPASIESSRSIPQGMVLIEGGSFLMGDEDEIDAQPHEVVVSAFHIDTHLVTQEQYERAMNSNPSRWKGGQNPVEQVRWSDAVRFCNKRSELEGLEPCYDLETWACNFDANGYRLPTEAEWEYACRGGATTPYFFGRESSKLGEFAWFDKNSDGRPHPVGKKKPNPWGLYDICGNVWEWCNDFYKVDYYQESPNENPRGPAEGDSKVVRGGAWRFSDESCRSGYRYNENPGYADVCFGYDIYGFRCVRNATDPTGK